MLTIFSSIFYSNTPNNTDKKDDNKVADNTNKSQTSSLKNLIKAFSVQRNFKSIISNDSPRFLPAVDGFRVICVTWVTIGHTFFFSLGSIDNIKLNFVYADAWLLQPIYASILTVDIFFVISGFLQAYNYKEQQKKNPSKNLAVGALKKIFQRYFQICLTFGIVSQWT